VGAVTDWAARHTSEADLMSAVTEYLELRERQRDLFWSVTDPASKDPRERGRRVRKGWSDITACVRGGRFLGIEMKRPKRSRTSAEQLKFRETINKLGGVAVECRSVQEVHAAIERAIQ
jgi:hypothetical protein